MGVPRVDLLALIELRRLLMGVSNPTHSRIEFGIVREEGNAVSQVAGSGAGSADEPVIRKQQAGRVGCPRSGTRSYRRWLRSSCRRRASAWRSLTMTSAELIPAVILKRKAVVYVRQSTQSQVMTNLESKRRQYDLVDVARQRGFVDVEIIDDDLGRSASGTVARPGFDRLVAWLCAGKVGAVLCFDASRLARNGRDWHHLLELCGLVEARVINSVAHLALGQPRAGLWNARRCWCRARCGHRRERG